jgi:hypothetical protein
MRFWTKVLVASSVATMVGSAACTTKTDDAGGPAGPKYPDVQSYCTARAQAECSQTAITNCASPSSDACVATREAKCNGASPTDRTYRADQAEACVNAVAAAYADAIIEPSEVDDMNKACGVLFQQDSGTAGVACAVDTDCKLSDGFACVLHADATTQTIKGTCESPTPAAAGDSCSAADAQCADGLYCDTGSHCVKQGVAGDPCSAIQPCGKGLACDATSNKCVSKAATGSACTSDADCADGICDKGANPVCVAKLILSPNEPACADFR